MSILNDDLIAVVGDKTISVHRRSIVDANILSLSGGETAYELRVDGIVADTHKHGTLARSGSLFATPVHDGIKTSIRVDVKPSMFSVKYKLFVNDVEVALQKCSEAEIKALWHKKSLG